MMKKILIAFAATAMLGMGSAAHAIGVGGKVSTLGLGAELGYQVSDRIVARAAITNFKQGADQTISGNQSTVDLELSSTALLLDFSPFSQGSLHVTVGYILNNSKLSGTSQISNFGGTTYPTQTVSTSIEFGSGPYLGIGYGNVAAPGIGLTFELGVLQSGAPKAHLSTSAPVDPADVAAEEKQMQSDLNQFDIYPVISAGISIGF